MKTIYNKISSLIMLLAASASLLGFLSSCDNELEPYPTASETDAPKILNTNLLDPKEGQPYGLPTIHRNENFTFDVIVTPAQYTTVEWFIDGEKVFEGPSIDMPLLAGEYSVKIVATTTKGLSTWRDCALSVLPLDGDPTMANDPKSRWLTVGDTKTIDFSNTTDIAKVFIGSTEVSACTFAGGKLNFTVPEMADGDYQLSIQTSDGAKYGCGKVTVSHEAYIDPGVKETVIWEGDVVIDWGNSNVTLASEQVADAVGKQLVVYFEIFNDFAEGQDDYHSFRVTNGDWSSDVVPQIDGFDSQSSPYVIDYTAEHQAAVVDKNGIVFTGYGYRITKIAIRESSAPKESVLWEGDVVIDWGNSNVTLAPEQVADAVGKQIVVYFEIFNDFAEGQDDYHAFRVTNGDWSSDVVPQIDGFDSQSSPYVIDYTAEHQAAVVAGNGLLFTGYGYRITKIAIREAAVAAETTLWEGELVADWGGSNVKLEVSDVEPFLGKQIVVYFEIFNDFAEGQDDYHAFRVTNGDWSSDVVPQIDGFDSQASPYVIDYTAEHQAAVVAGNGLLFTGYGYKLTKITGR